MGYARNNSSDSAPLSNSLRWKHACGRMDICAKSTRASVCRNRDVNFTKHRVSIIDLKIDPLLLSDNSNSRSRNTHPPVPFSFFFASLFPSFSAYVLPEAAPVQTPVIERNSREIVLAWHAISSAASLNALHFPSRDFANGRTRAEF